MLGGVHQSKTVEVRRSPPNMFRSEKIFHKTYDTYRGLNVRSFAIFEPVPRPRYVEHRHVVPDSCVLSNLVLHGKVLSY